MLAFGFSQTEVDKLLKDTGLRDHTDEMREWYDGYRFGNMDVYCPWDVVNHVNRLLINPKAKPIGYWKNSSGNEIIRSFIDYSGPAITQKLEALLSGECIVENIQEDITYDYMHSTEDNLWSILYLTGYLTRARDGEEKKELPQGSYTMKIPNKEVREIFESVIKTWFMESTQQIDRKALFASVWNGDAEKATAEITKLLRRTISYYDYREDFYHAFFCRNFCRGRVCSGIQQRTWGRQK